MKMVKNRPSQYVKRSDLLCRTPHVGKLSADAISQPSKRDISAAKIDQNFYFIFHSETTPKSK